MIDREKLEGKLRQLPILQYEFIKTEELVFSERVRYICKSECPMYGTSWACPPAVGSVEECRRRCLEFEDALLIVTAAEVSDAENMEETLSTREEHEETVRMARDFIDEQASESYALSSESCSFCRECTWPDAPCRRPDKMMPCVESHGIVVTDIAEKYGISFLPDGHTVMWFAVIFYK